MNPLSLLQCVVLIQMLHATKHIMKDLRQRLLIFQIWFVRSTLLQRSYCEITDSPNMLCMVNHTMENLQHGILDSSKDCLLHCHMKIESGKERLRWGREKYRVRNRRVMAIQFGKTTIYCTYNGCYNPQCIMDDQLQIAQAHSLMVEHLSRSIFAVECA